MAAAPEISHSSRKMNFSSSVVFPDQVKNPDKKISGLKKKEYEQSKSEVPKITKMCMESNSSPC